MVQYNTPYKELHRRIQKQLGKAEICSSCFRTSKITRIEWANISGEYKEDLEDWLPLCRTCHMDFDDVNQKVWKTRREKYGKKGYTESKRWTDESRKKMSEMKKGVKFTEVHKKNILIAQQRRRRLEKENA